MVAVEQPAAGPAYPSRIIKAGALAPDTRALLAYWGDRRRGKYP
jgi:hypothetical protein